MRCLIYARVSLDPRGESRSVTEQEAECRAWADREGWTITHVITETGSASRYARSTKARSRWTEVTTALTTGNYDALLTWESSRATRDLTAYAALRDLCATHGIQWGYSGTLYDLTNRDARFRTGLDALLAEDESARTSERGRRAVRARAAAGQPHGKILYGYTRTYDPSTGTPLDQHPHPDTAQVVRDIYTRTIAGESNAAIARHLTAAGIAPPRPARSPHRPAAWIGSTIHRIIRNPAYAGHRTHHGVIVAPATWEPIVDQDTWDRANAILDARHTGAPRTDGRAHHLLSGIAHCGMCGTPLYHIKNRGYPSYACMRDGCQRVTRSALKLDAYVTGYVRGLLTDHRPDLTPAANTSTPELAAALAELNDLEQRLAGFTDQGITGAITPATLARIEQGLAPKITAVRRRVRALQVPDRLRDIDLDAALTDWDGQALDVKRTIIAATVTIEVLPMGRGSRQPPSPDNVRITPTWAGRKA